jgi:hypothetical protein
MRHNPSTSFSEGAAEVEKMDFFNSSNPTLAAIPVSFFHSWFSIEPIWCVNPSKRKKEEKDNKRTREMEQSRGS